MSEAMYRVRSGGRVFGPFSSLRIAELVADGKVDSDAMVCGSGETQWVPLATVLSGGGSGGGDPGGGDPGGGDPGGGDPGGGLEIIEDDEDEEVYRIASTPTVAGGPPVPDTIPVTGGGSGIPLPGTAPPMAGGVPAGNPTAGPAEVIDDGSAWEADGLEIVDEDFEEFEEYDEDDEDDGLEEVESFGLSERGKRQILLFCLWTGGILLAGIVVVVAYMFARSTF